MNESRLNFWSLYDLLKNALIKSVLEQSQYNIFVRDIVKYIWIVFTFYNYPNHYSLSFFFLTCLLGQPHFYPFVGVIDRGFGLTLKKYIIVGTSISSFRDSISLLSWARCKSNSPWRFFILLPEDWSSSLIRFDVHGQIHLSAFCVILPSLCAWPQEAATNLLFFYGLQVLLPLGCWPSYCCERCQSRLWVRCWLCPFPFSTFRTSLSRASSIYLMSAV